MGQYRFLTWYRLKSNQDHLFLKISGRGYLDEQPTSIEDANLFATETLEATKEMHDIITQDNRILVIKLDLRDFSFEELNFGPFMKYVVQAANQGMDLAFFEVLGASSYWNYLAAFLPKYTRDRIVLK
jgi:hypothetical protein